MKRKKETKNIYDKAITMENLYKMWLIIKKTCKNKRELYYFSLNLNSNLYSIYLKLKNKTYKPSKYRTFMIFEPKPRLVMSQSIEDKIVNHFVTNYYLLPYLDKSLINENVATRKNLGGKYAINLIRKYFNNIIINNRDKEIYCLKIDISKYFYSINHDILIDKISKKIYDKDVINIIKLIINETNSSYINENIKRYNGKFNTDIPYYKYNVGLSIGAMSSQFMAIYFLNEIDHYIKEVLHCKYYVRYMDDFLILDTNKDRLKDVFKIITNKLNDIDLRVNKKSNIYRSSIGFNFLGYKYVLNNNKLIICCKRKTVIRIKRRLRKLHKVNYLKYLRSKSSYRGYLSQIYSLNKVHNNLEFWWLYYAYKMLYKDYIIIIKDGSLYRIYKDSNEPLIISNRGYDELISSLEEKKLHYLVANKNTILLIN